MQRRDAEMTQSSLSQPPSLASLKSASPVSLFLDFDGTLIEIASGPDAIAVPENMSARLKSLADQHDGRVAIVSGRDLNNLEQHLGPLAIARAGSHGAERKSADGTPLGEMPKPLAADDTAQLREIAAEHGALFENKRYGAALHYRSVPAAGPDIEAAAASIAKQSGLTMKRGKCVIELVRPGANKASAVHAFMETPIFAGSTPIFIGDDVTDEDGFVAVQKYGGLAIAVGERPSNNANFKLDNVKDVHAWLNL